MITNSSTLISLAKIGKLDILNHIEGPIYAPRYVYEETVEVGEKKQVIDATLISNTFQSGLIKIKEVDKESWDKTKRLLNKELKPGDHDVISLAFQLNIKEILTDDDNLSKIAEVLGFRTKSSADLLLECLKIAEMDWNEYEISIRSLVLKDRMAQKMAELYLLRGGEIVKRK